MHETCIHHGSNHFQCLFIWCSCKVCLAYLTNQLEWTQAKLEFLPREFGRILWLALFSTNKWKGMTTFSLLFCSQLLSYKSIDLSEITLSGLDLAESWVQNFELGMNSLGYSHPLVNCYWNCQEQAILILAMVTDPKTIKW